MMKNCYKISNNPEKISQLMQGLLMVLFANMSFICDVQAKDTLTLTQEQKDWVMRRSFVFHKTALKRTIYHLEYDYLSLRGKLRSGKFRRKGMTQNNLDRREITQKQLDQRLVHEKAASLAAGIIGWYEYDANMDGLITIDEIKKSSEYDDNKENFTKADMNKNNILTFQEIAVFVKHKYRYFRSELNSHWWREQQFPQFLDIDKSGGVSMQDWQQVIETGLKAYDLNQNKRFDKSEREAMIAAQKKAKELHSQAHKKHFNIK